ncbi:MAG TPA: hypothetical protein VL992_04935 [Tepidisphaeraceae bacterium]|nr:hypothetical protein [Tepidisphaeraceae bacterium]
MPYGFFTIEQWTTKRGGKHQWTVVEHLDAGHKLSNAIHRIEQLGKPGLYRVIQTQRTVWAEMENGCLRVRRWHVGNADSLARGAAAFVRDGGKWPQERHRQEIERIKTTRRAKKERR